jgi:hypothetical protein
MSTILAVFRTDPAIETDPGVGCQPFSVSRRRLLRALAIGQRCFQRPRLAPLSQFSSVLSVDTPDSPRADRVNICRDPSFLFPERPEHSRNDAVRLALKRSPINAAENSITPRSLLTDRNPARVRNTHSPDQLARTKTEVFGRKRRRTALPGGMRFWVSI